MFDERFDLESFLRSLADRLDRMDAKIETLITNGVLEMSALDDLAAAVAALQAQAQAATTAIATELANLATATSNNDSAAIEAAVANITAVNSGLAAAVASTQPAANTTANTAANTAAAASANTAPAADANTTPAANT